jgi:hypothetical protein
MSPPFGVLSKYVAPPGLSPQERIKAEVGSKEDRRFKTLQQFSEATGHDRHSVIVDYDLFQKVTPPDPNDPRILYQPADFNFELRSGSVAVDAGARLPNINTDSPGRRRIWAHMNWDNRCCITGRANNRGFIGPRFEGYSQYNRVAFILNFH